MDEAVELGPGTVYARQVGQRLRAIRRQKGLSLQEVEASSGQEFKASVLGAYERGERIISVPRLQRLANYYQVPVDQLLPQNGDRMTVDGTNGDGDTADGTRRRMGDRPQKVTFDLTKFQGVDDPELEMVRQYLSAIQVQRQDFNGRMLTIRRDDIRAIASLFGTDADALIRRLEDFELRLPT